MAKRDPEPEAVEEDLVAPEPSPVGERLRVAREAKGLSLEDLAAQTRIPQRHLASIETGDWEHLPAPTYTIGFAKNYASSVGLDRNEIGNDLREEMGGQRFTAASTDVFEPADPARTMPKGLVIGAIAAVVLLVVLMSWLNQRSLQGSDGPVAATETNSVAAQPQQPVAMPPTGPAIRGPVVLTATAPVWLQVSEKGGATLFSGMLQPGQKYDVPAVTAPVLKTGKPEALRITVGNTVAGPVGAAATTVSNVSLLPADLLKASAAAQTNPPPVTLQPLPAPRSRVRRQAAPAALPPPAAATPEPAPTTNGQ